MLLVYALTDPRDGSIRYVGKSTLGMVRPREHAGRAARERTPKAAWVRKLARLGLVYGIQTLEVCRSVDELEQRERHWIAYGLERGWRLLNIGEGGKGSQHNRRRDVPSLEVVRRYVAGESENELAKRYRIGRQSIRRRLVAAGIPIRGGSEANRLTAAKLTPRQRKARARAANEATRGCVRSEATRLRLREAWKIRRAK